MSITPSGAVDGTEYKLNGRRYQKAAADFTEFNCVVEDDANNGWYKSHFCTFFSDRRRTSQPPYFRSGFTTYHTHAWWQTIKQTVKYLEMLNQSTVFGNVAQDATLTAGVSDTVLSKLKIPRTRGLFPAADESITLAWER
ncbi:hypothetical protein BLNAU_9038 [Blattamonas nauphoetae]|uniref:Uncharacterized protein n=1 Tax=Blattamonas nauphoetae TaxID=2049346 RepID=A0ABQ9XX63_9EUKA|nr:hypothetical protein BLNAU_9038 [Blattamonas nauphoetae]